MRSINTKRLGVLATEVGFLTTVMVSNVQALVPDKITEGLQSAKPSGAPEQLFGPNSIFQAIANALIFLVGAIAVIMLIVGGLRYVLSSGNSSSVEGAKNTILYAIIGIVVAILAFAAVNFVVNQVGQNTT